MNSVSTNSERRPFSIKLWPPSENTRKMLVERMTTNITSKSFFTQKYGTLGKKEATDESKRIEDIAFTTANQNYEKQPDGDGAAAVQLYAKECSRLLLEVMKRDPNVEANKEAGSDITSSPRETFFDISKGRRAFIEADEAEKLLMPLKEAGNSYSKICFSNRSFGLEAARVTVPILVSLKDRLKEVDLSDFIAGRAELEALEVMKLFSDALEGSILKYLNLSDNALGEKGVRAFASLLKSQTCLEELYLMNDGISKEAAQAVSELIPSTDKLRVLQFHTNMTGDEGAFAIAEVVKRSPLLEDFRCSSTRIDSKGGVALSIALETCTNLMKLDLRDNMFGVEGGIALSKSLHYHANLKKLYLSYLNLEDEGSISIANVLKDTCAPALEVLEMAGNDITSEAATELAACIAQMPNLISLNLGENELKDEGTIQISKALEGHIKLKEIDMNTNLIRRAGARVLAQTVVQKPGFVLLNINGNFISDEGVDEVRDIFKKFPDMLGALDENDPEGEDGDGDGDEESVADENDEDELGSKLKNLEVNEEN